MIRVLAWQQINDGWVGGGIYDEVKGSVVKCTAIPFQHQVHSVAPPSCIGVNGVFWSSDVALPGGRI